MIFYKHYHLENLHSSPMKQIVKTKKLGSWCDLEVKQVPC